MESPKVQKVSHWLSKNCFYLKKEHQPHQPFKVVSFLRVIYAQPEPTPFASKRPGEASCRRTNASLDGLGKSGRSEPKNVLNLLRAGC